MERRTASAAASAIAMILVAGALAAGANMGLLSSSGSDAPAGKLKPSDAAAVTPLEPQVITVEVKDPASSASAEVQAVEEPPVSIVTIPAPDASAGSSSRRSAAERDDEEDEEDEEDERDEDDEHEEEHEEEDEHEDGRESDD